MYVNKELMSHLYGGKRKKEKKNKRKNKKRKTTKRKTTKRKTTKRKIKKRKTTQKKEKIKSGNISTSKWGKRWKEERENKKMERLLRVKEKDLINLNVSTNKTFNPVNLMLIKNVSGAKDFIPTYNDVMLENIEYVSKGAYGSVYRFSDEENKTSITVKMFKSSKGGLEDAEEESRIIEQLLIINNGISAANDCSMINARVIYYDDKNNTIIDKSTYEELKKQKKIFILMDNMDSALPVGNEILALLKNVPRVTELSLEIMQIITKNVKCLFDKGFYYCDLKPGNILYKAFDDKLKIYFGDLGSIYDSNINTKENDDVQTIWSLPPPEMGGIVKSSEVTDFESSIVWSIGASLLFMIPIICKPLGDATILNPLLRFLQWRVIDSYSKKIDKYYEEITEKLEKIKPYIDRLKGIEDKEKNNYSLWDLINLIFQRPDKRITLDRIIDLKFDIYVSPPENPIVEEVD